MFGSLPEVVQCAAVKSHIVFLLKDGRICRYRYKIKTETSSGNSSKYTSFTDEGDSGGRSSKAHKKDAESSSWDASAGPDNILPSMR